MLEGPIGDISSSLSLDILSFRLPKKLYSRSFGSSYSIFPLSPIMALINASSLIGSAFIGRKQFVASLILCSANAFSFTKLPTGLSSSGCESRFNCASKVTKASKKSTVAYATASRGIAMQAKSKKCFKK